MFILARQVYEVNTKLANIQVRMLLIWTLHCSLCFMASGSYCGALLRTEDICGVRVCVRACMRVCVLTIFIALIAC